MRQGLLALIEGPEGVRVALDFSRKSFERVIPLLDRMPPTFREDLLCRWVRMWRDRDVDIALAIDAIVSRIPPSELSLAFWKTWAGRIASLDVYCLRRDEGDARLGSIPDEIMNEDIALVFAKKGLGDRIPDRLMSREIVRSLARTNRMHREAPEFRRMLPLEDIADVYGCSNGQNLDEMPSELRTLDMARMIIQRSYCVLAKLVEMLKRGDFDLTGLPVETVVEEFVHAAVARDPAAIKDAGIPLSREVYLDVIRREPELLSWVPLEYRDVEMCSAAISDNRKHSLCHFPEWVVQEIRDTNGGAHGITGNYRPSQRYSDVLKGLRKPEAELPAALIPFKNPAVRGVSPRR